MHSLHETPWYPLSHVHVSGFVHVPCSQRAHAIDVQGVPAGVHTLRAVVYDSCGSKVIAASAPEDFTVH